jgi:hypothetical protein
MRYERHPDPGRRPSLRLNRLLRPRTLRATPQLRYEDVQSSDRAWSAPFNDAADSVHSNPLQQQQPNHGPSNSGSSNPGDEPQPKRRLAAGRPLVGLDRFFVAHDDPVAGRPIGSPPATPWTLSIRGSAGPLYIDLHWIELARRMARRVNAQLVGDIVVTFGTRAYSRRREPLSMRFKTRPLDAAPRGPVPPRVAVHFEFV